MNRLVRSPRETVCLKHCTLSVEVGGWLLCTRMHFVFGRCNSTALLSWVKYPRAAARWNTCTHRRKEMCSRPCSLISARQWFSGLVLSRWPLSLVAFKRPSHTSQLSPLHSPDMGTDWGGKWLVKNICYMGQLRFVSVLGPKLCS